MGAGEGLAQEEQPVKIAVVFVAGLAACGVEGKYPAQFEPPAENPQIVAATEHPDRDPIVRCAGPLEDGTEVRYEVRQLAAGKFVSAHVNAEQETRIFGAGGREYASTPLVFWRAVPLGLRLEPRHGRLMLRVEREEGPTELLGCQIQPIMRRVNSQ